MLPEERMSLLNEVRLYLDVLADFKDVVPQGQLDQIKRELFNCLPPLPNKNTFGMKRPNLVTEQGEEGPGTKKGKHQRGRNHRGC